MSRNQGSAKRADRAVLELARILSDGNWHSTSYLAVAAGKYVRPEIAWRYAQGSTVLEGQRRYVNQRLHQWERFGRVQKRKHGRFTEWRSAKTEWVQDYLAELDRRRAGSGQGSARLGTLHDYHVSVIYPIKTRAVMETMLRHKPGRPRAVPDNLVKVAANLYQQGYGYRAIARMLKHEGVSPCFGTIRNIIKGQKTV